MVVSQQTHGLRETHNCDQGQVPEGTWGCHLPDLKKRRFAVQPCRGGDQDCHQASRWEARLCCRGEVSVVVAGVEMDGDWRTKLQFPLASLSRWCSDSRTNSCRELPHLSSVLSG